MQPTYLPLLLLTAACISTPRPQSTRADSAAAISSSGQVSPGAPETTADTSASSPAPSGASTSTADLTRVRTLIDESEAACTASDYASARAKAAEAVTALLAMPEAEQDATWIEFLNEAGKSAWRARDAHTARRAWLRVLDLCVATLPDDHPGLQLVRGNLAIALYELGDLAGAQALQEISLEFHERTLPDDHPDLQIVRQNLGITLRSSGDLAGAQALLEKVLEVNARTLPDDHIDLQLARQSLGASLYSRGDFAGARNLFVKVLEVFSRTLPDDHPDLQGARMNLAATSKELGDLAGAQALLEKVLEVYARALPDDHPDMQRARNNLANTLAGLGDLSGARTLREKVLEVDSRTLPDDHPDLQRVRNNLANALAGLGDLSGAQTLREKVLEVDSRTLPEDHPELQLARSNLAATMISRGDLEGARALLMEALEVQSRTHADDHPALQATRGSLAQTILALGDPAGAQALLEKVLEVLARTLPDDHPDVQKARRNLAWTLRALGDLSGARALEEQGLEVLARTLPDDHPDLQEARAHLALTIASQVARTGRIPGDMERCADLIGARCRAQVHSARSAIVGSPGREAEERCSSLAKALEMSLSFAIGYGGFEPLRMLDADSFDLSETTRAAALVSAGLTRKAASAPRYGELRDALRDASDELAGLAQNGTTSEEFDRARTKRELVEREIVALARELSGGEHTGVELDVESLAASLEEREAAVGFRRFTKLRLDIGENLDATGQPALHDTSVESLCAFVVRSSKASAHQGSSVPLALTLVDLGPIAPIEEAVRAWRDGLGVGSDSRGLAGTAREDSTPGGSVRGSALRERIFDPLLPAIAGAQRIVVALDDVLHLVPLDALPFDESSLLGDHWRIETRATLTELLQAPEPSKESGQLVAFGDVEYGAEAATVEADPAAQLVSLDFEPRAAEDAGILRGSAWSQGFSALPGTGAEVRGIVRGFRNQFGADAAPELCEHAVATRERLLSLAPKARWLHIATHGWFAPDSIKSWIDAEPLDKKSGLGARMSGTEQVKGMSPMLLCGLALAGANLPENAVGRVPGLVTADELSTLDLTNCELVVLSACDTNVGERRGGQGVASLQKALQMAGAHSVITSLWKVPDEATKELMLDFYRRLWAENKPKYQALWEAKKKLRDAQDERGNPRYTTRDWAAWVLTGEPD